MMRKIIFIVCLFSSMFAFAQKYMTRNAEIYFLSDLEALETVEATNKQVGAVIDMETGAIAFQAQMRAFHFDIALMEEHFNENYVESDLYPKATFKGSFVQLPSNLLEEKELVAQGVLNFHGVEKEIQVPVKLQLVGDELVAESNFKLLCSDFDIKIPRLVADKLTNEIQITVTAILTKI